MIFLILLTDLIFFSVMILMQKRAKVSKLLTFWWNSLFLSPLLFLANFSMIELQNKNYTENLRVRGCVNDESIFAEIIILVEMNICVHYHTHLISQMTILTTIYVYLICECFIRVMWNELWRLPKSEAKLCLLNNKAL